MNIATALSTAAPVIPNSFHHWLFQFLDYLHLEKHFSDYTVKSYGLI